MTGRLRVAAVGDIAEGTARLIQAPMGPIAVFRVGDDYLAVDDRCPHRAGPLSEGTVRAGTVSCPWHGSRFDLRTGAVQDGPARRPLRRYSVAVENGEIFLEVPEGER